ncbi:MAG: hypothetical protein WBA61_11490 [Aequorivita sp.]
MPRVCAELTLESLPKLRPFVDLGYGFLIFNTASRGVTSSSSVTLNGLNGNAGAYYLLTTSLYAQLQYDYIKLFDENVLGQSDANNVSIIKFGLGLLL